VTGLGGRGEQRGDVVEGLALGAFEAEGELLEGGGFDSD
jgi:hypothetical protein